MNTERLAGLVGLHGSGPLPSMCYADYWTNGSNLGGYDKPMNAREMVNLIGKVGLLKVADFELAVTVVDVRPAYGRVQYLVEADKPSKGSAWVDAGRVKVQG